MSAAACATLQEFLQIHSRIAPHSTQKVSKLAAHRTDKTPSLLFSLRTSALIVWHEKVNDIIDELAILLLSIPKQPVFLLHPTPPIQSNSLPTLATFPIVIASVLLR